jgi:hypothetical protein
VPQGRGVRVAAVAPGVVVTASYRRGPQRGEGPDEAGGGEALVLDSSHGLRASAGPGEGGRPGVPLQRAGVGEAGGVVTDLTEQPRTDDGADAGEVWSARGRATGTRTRPQSRWRARPRRCRRHRAGAAGPPFGARNSHSSGARSLAQRSTSSCRSATRGPVRARRFFSVSTYSSPPRTGTPCETRSRPRPAHAWRTRTGCPACARSGWTSTSGGPPITAPSVR